MLQADLYGTEDLICSFDGLVLCRPWGLDPSWRVKANGLHLDGSTVRMARNPTTGELEERKHLHTLFLFESDDRFVSENRKTDELVSCQDRLGADRRKTLFYNLN